MSYNFNEISWIRIDLLVRTIDRYLSVKFYDLENAKSVDSDILHKLMTNWTFKSFTDRPNLGINLPRLEYLHIDTLLDLGVSLETESLKNFPIFYFFDKSYRPADLASEIGFENIHAINHHHLYCIYKILNAEISDDLVR